MTNFDIDLIQEALMIAMRDKYFTPSNYKDFNAKYQKVQEVWQKLESMRIIAPE